jgi:uncharacterized cofD-like protein
MTKKRVVVVGGGTGTHTVLRGLRRYADELDISAVVSMADSGGSTGRLRDEFGQLPVGDVRNALTALAADGDNHDALLRKLFSYRFDRGRGLSGHNFGNLLLTALTDILGSEIEAIEAASRILRVSGKVIPVTTDDVHLVAEYKDGSVVVGEGDIDESLSKYSDMRITNLSLTPSATISDLAAKTILEADLLVLGPGDLYTSVLANCVVDGFVDVVAESNAKVVYVCNLMSKQGQTVGMNALEHITEVVKYIGCKPDFALVNVANFKEDLIQKYATEGDFPILNNCTDSLGIEIICESLAAQEEIKLESGDMLKRSLIRHDSDLLAGVLYRLL